MQNSATVPEMLGSLLKQKFNEEKVDKKLDFGSAPRTVGHYYIATNYDVRSSEKRWLLARSARIGYCNKKCVENLVEFH